MFSWIYQYFGTFNQNFLWVLYQLEDFSVRSLPYTRTVFILVFLLLLFTTIFILVFLSSYSSLQLRLNIRTNNQIKINIPVKRIRYFSSFILLLINS